MRILALVFALLWSGLSGAIANEHYEAGLKAVKEESWAAAVGHMTEGSLDGHAGAQFYLGQFYRYGKGVEKSFVEARNWYLLAAKQDHPKAQFILGMMNRKGVSVSKNHRQAFQWFLKSAQGGDAKAQNLLGTVYSLGQGVKGDKAKSMEWYRKSVEQGYKVAQFNLANRYRTGRAVTKNLETAFALYRKAANQGYGRAQYRLGLMLAEGQGTKRDFGEAERWLKQAKKNGVKKATAKLVALQEERKSSEKLANLRDPANDPPDLSGNVVRYKGYILVKSKYPKADNKTFIRMLKKAIDMSAKLPKHLREQIKLVRRVEFDPPSKLRKPKGYRANIVAVYTWYRGDPWRVGRIVMNKDPLYSSPLQMVYSFVGNSFHAVSHMDQIRQIRIVRALEKAGVENDDPLITKARARFNFLRERQKNRQGRAFRLQRCKIARAILSVHKAYGAAANKINGLSRQLNDRGCP